MRSSNPVLSRDDVFTRGGYAGFHTAGGAVPGVGTQVGEVRAPAGVRPMTLDDVVSRTGLLLLIAVITGGLAWVLVPVEPPGAGFGVAMVAALAGLVLAIVNSVKRAVSPPLIMAYAAVEGVFLGVISHTLETLYSGIVVQAVAATGVTFGVMLVLYRTGRIRVTPRFTKVLVGAMFGYLGFLVINLVLSFFGYGANLWSGGFALVTAVFAVGLASLFLTLDFDEIERGVRAGAPEQEAWRAAFGLMVTLVWLYFELLRLIAILRGE
jgi:uncharacterized YccA/Bax inhibitor family protein